MWFLPSTINTPLADTLEEAQERKSELVKFISKQKNEKSDSSWKMNLNFHFGNAPLNPW